MNVRENGGNNNFRSANNSTRLPKQFQNLISHGLAEISRKSCCGFDVGDMNKRKQSNCIWAHLIAGDITPIQITIFRTIFESMQFNKLHKNFTSSIP